MKKTKIDLLKEHLRSGKSITQLEAIGLYSLFRLAARVHELKKQGWNIVTNVKRDANGSEYAEYTLVEAENNNPHGLPDFALPERKGAAQTDEPPIAVRGDYWRA